jgi:hypothetical protein
MADEHIRKELTRLLRSGGAHASFDDIMLGFPAKLRGIKPSGAPHSAWQLLEHMQLAQWDIVEYTRNSRYVPLKFPDDYWPETDAPPDAKAWTASMNAFKKGLSAMEGIVQDPKAELFARIAHGNGETIFSQALLLVDHNSYHLGQLMMIRRSLR